MGGRRDQEGSGDSRRRINPGHNTEEEKRDKVNEAVKKGMEVPKRMGKGGDGRRRGRSLGRQTRTPRANYSWRDGVGNPEGHSEENPEVTLG